MGKTTEKCEQCGCQEETEWEVPFSSSPGMHSAHLLPKAEEKARQKPFEANSYSSLRSSSSTCAKTKRVKVTTIFRSWATVECLWTFCNIKPVPSTRWCQKCQYHKYNPVFVLWVLHLFILLNVFTAMTLHIYIYIYKNISTEFCIPVFTKKNPILHKSIWLYITTKAKCLICFSNYYETSLNLNCCNLELVLYNFQYWPQSTPGSAKLSFD